MNNQVSNEVEKPSGSPMCSVHPEFKAIKTVGKLDMCSLCYMRWQNKPEIYDEDEDE